MRCSTGRLETQRSVPTITELFREWGYKKKAGGTKRDQIPLFEKYSVGSRNTGLKGRQVHKKTWMKVRRNAEKSRSDLGALWGVDAGRKGKDCCLFLIWRKGQRK